MDDSDLDMFFKPKSVAIIGVSTQTRKFGHVIFSNFLESNINAKIYPVNPRADMILGVPCYKSLLDIPGPIDLVVIALSRKFAVKTMNEAAKKQVKGVIIIAGGFSEVGEEGKAIEEEVLKIAKENKIRIIGPNVIGIYDPYSGVDTLFLPRYRVLRPKRGNLGFISQSGAFGSALLDFAASNGVGISKFCSIGNAIDVDAVDVLEYLEKDPNTKCIIMYLEGIKTKDAKNFHNVIKRITLIKPIVLLKGGITNEGQKAAASHTGSIASQIEVLQALFKQAGVIQAKDVLQLFDMGRILSASYLPKGDQIAIITNAGGFGVLTTDALINQGFKLAKLSDETINTLQEAFPPEVIVSNPTDLVGNANTERYRIALNKIVQDPNVDIIILIILLSVSYVESDIIDVINDVKLTYKKPIIVTTIGGDFTKMMIKMMEENHVPTFSSPKRTVDAVKALVNYSNHCDRNQCVLK